jgi:triosephosphate isomerase
MVEKAHAYCRGVLNGLFGKRKADVIPILYGGSVTPLNVFSIVSKKDVNGVLVGGSSLEPQVLAEIALNCSKPAKPVKSAKAIKKPVKPVKKAKKA